MQKLHGKGLRNGTLKALGIAVGALLTLGGLPGCRGWKSQIETKIEIRPRDVLKVKIKKNKIKMKWTTHRQYVDQETGEILRAQQIQQKKYIILETQTKHIKQNEYFGKKFITHKCGRNYQTEIWGPTSGTSENK